MKTFVQQSFYALTAATALGLGASVASAAILAQYTYPDPNTEASTVQPANGSASVISTNSLSSVGRSSSFWDTSLGALDTSNGSRFFTVASVNGTSESEAITQGDYHQFTITPSTGYQIDFSEIRFSAALGGSGIGGDNPDLVSYFVRTSLDSYAATVGSTLSVSTAAASNGSVWPSVTIPLGAGFQAVQTPVTFRIYMYKLTGTDAQYARLDSVQVSGDITLIPEPASLGLLGLGGLMMLRRRR